MALSTTRQARAAETATEIIGVAGRYPGSGEGVAGFFQSLAAEEDLPRQVPHERWDLERYYSPEARGDLIMYTRAAAFLDRLDEFDTSLFRCLLINYLNAVPAKRGKVRLQISCSLPMFGSIYSICVNLSLSIVEEEVLQGNWHFPESSSIRTFRMVVRELCNVRWYILTNNTVFVAGHRGHLFKIKKALVEGQ